MHRVLSLQQRRSFAWSPFTWPLCFPHLQFGPNLSRLYLSLLPWETSIPHNSPSIGPRTGGLIQYVTGSSSGAVTWSLRGRGGGLRERSEPSGPCEVCHCRLAGVRGTNCQNLVAVGVCVLRGPRGISSLHWEMRISAEPKGCSKEEGSSYLHFGSREGGKIAQVMAEYF